MSLRKGLRWVLSVRDGPTAVEDQALKERGTVRPYPPTQAHAEVCAVKDGVLDVVDQGLLGELCAIAAYA